MPRRLLFALLVLVAAPLALLGWLSASTYRQQQKTAREQLDVLYQTRLAEIDRSLTYVIDRYARDLEIAVFKSDDALEILRRLDHSDPTVRATILINNRGVLVYPPKPTSTASDQYSLHASLPAIIGSRPDLLPALDSDDIFEAATGTDFGQDVGKLPEDSKAEHTVTAKPVATKPSPFRSSVSKTAPQETFSKSTSASLGKSAPIVKGSSKGMGNFAPPPRTGNGRWQVWYMDEGIQLIYWIPRDEGAAAGILLERARWVSDLTAALPDSLPLQATLTSRREVAGFTALTNESGRVVYRWGDDTPRGAPLAVRPLSAPLTSWSLEYHSDDPLPGSASMALLVSLAGIGVVLLSLGAYVLTGVQRQMQAARNRVSFASQVSHELRTPLTNIRLYAELAESDLEQLPESDPRISIQRRLGVIDTESRRLGRLVSGVLEMIRDNRRQQGPRIATAVPDEVIDQTLQQFAPSFENLNLEVKRFSAADRKVGFDADILEMILVNLLSNVEKYASDGKSVEVQSAMESNWLVVRVTDDGPGIAWRHRRSVFRPFTRLDDSISAPSGTGIGLTIAKRLARRHGGSLELVSSSGGACFELRLPTETTPSGGIHNKGN